MKMNWAGLGWTQPSRMGWADVPALKKKLGRTWPNCVGWACIGPATRSDSAQPRGLGWCSSPTEQKGWLLHGNQPKYN
jgi:hypothetical protein